MITYEAVFNRDEQKGIFDISFVKSPAMIGTWIAFSEGKKVKASDTIKLKNIDKEKRMLIGLVLQPNLEVYRKDEKTGEEYNIVFSEDVIEELIIEYSRQSNQNNSSIEHSKKIEGVTFFENWRVQDPEIDKSALYGFNYPKGSWLTMAKIDNDEVWERYIKTGEVLGLSIEGMVGLSPKTDKEVNLKTEIKMESNLVKDFITDVKTALGLEKPEVEVKLGSVKSGDVDIMFDGEMLEIGGAVWVAGEDETKVPLPVGEYPLDEKEQILVVTDEGMVGEIKEAVVEEEPAELAEPEAPSEGVLNQIKSLLIKYNEDNDAKFNALSIRFDEMKKENDTLKVELAEVSKEPAAKKIVATPVQLTAKGRILDKLRNN